MAVYKTGAILIISGMRSKWAFLFVKSVFAGKFFFKLLPVFKCWDFRQRQNPICSLSDAVLFGLL